MSFLPFDAYYRINILRTVIRLDFEKSLVQEEGFKINFFNQPICMGCPINQKNSDDTHVVAEGNITIKTLMIIIMKKIPVALFPIFFCSLLFANDVLTKDHLDRPIIEKKIILKEKNGKNYALSQKFLVIGEDDLLYIRASSSPETLKYGEDKCRSEGKILDIDYGSHLIKKSQNYIISCSKNLNLKNTIINKSYSSSPEERTINGFKNISSLNQYGEKIITKISTATAPNGRTYSIQQQFQEISKDKLLYITNSSTPETLQYNNELCKSVGGIDSTDKGVRLISKDLPSTLVCENVKNDISPLSGEQQRCNIRTLSKSNYNRKANSNNMVKNFL